MRRLTYYIAVSVDGRIAGPADEVEFYPQPEEYTAWMMEEYPDTLPTHVRKHLGLEGRPNRHFDTVVMGRRTYEPALAVGVTSPYAHLRQYVVSTSQDELDPAVTVVREDPLALVRRLKAEEGPLDIYLAGGAALAGAVLAEIDRFVVKLYPVVAGAGHPMFTAAGFAPAELELADLRTFASGNVVLTYDRRG
ncbi:dihydrofolate reductase family protein [Georgenia sp. H159]|uniref:dihydrofolate reductase family protein n=1 Tax=Georgenia sp. H159 TaxID=3076115 RepID=UPI002D793902|nr:dihydrofolate reductase family protein [Georgenia sp. H159]